METRLSDGGSAKIIALDKQQVMPWKNGGGTTRELCRLDDSAGMLWRASVATISESGPFSVFPGCDRIISLISGKAVQLNFADGERLDLRMFRPHHFSCDRNVSALIEDQSRDLNVIWRRADAEVHHDVVLVRDAVILPLRPANWHLLFACGGSITLGTHSQQCVLSSGEAVLVEYPLKAKGLDVSVSASVGVVFSFGITVKPQV